MMLAILEENEWASLGVMFIMSFLIGAVVGYGAWQNDIKDVYNLTQTQGM